MKTKKNTTPIPLDTPILFCNVGWMEFYNGEGYPTGGGSYESEGKHEIFNFQNNDGRCYGYVQPSYDTIKLERINPSASRNVKELQNVLVVWFASKPNGGGSVIVGWYKNATVYSESMVLEDNSPRTNYSFYMEADWRDCTLLPKSERNYPIPRSTRRNPIKGFPGRSNVWFADAPSVHSFREKTIQYINSYR